MKKNTAVKESDVHKEQFSLDFISVMKKLGFRAIRWQRAKPALHQPEKVATVGVLEKGLGDGVVL